MPFVVLIICLVKWNITLFGSGFVSVGSIWWSFDLWWRWLYKIWGDWCEAGVECFVCSRCWWAWWTSRIQRNKGRHVILFCVWFVVICLIVMMIFRTIWSISQLALPTETTTGTCFLQYYIESILALSEASYKQAAQGCFMDCHFIRTWIFLFFTNF